MTKITLLMTADEQIEFYRNLRNANRKDRIVLSSCQSDIQTLRRVSKELDMMCVSTAWDSVVHLQTHIDELISDLIDMQEDITDQEESE